MKIGIIGAGAMGCLYGSWLSKANEVTMICNRKEQSDEINQNGIKVYENDDSCHIFKQNVSACLSGECTEHFDLIIILTKTYDTDKAILKNKRIITNDTRVLTLQNGDNIETFEKYFSKDNIYVGVNKQNSVTLGNGIIKHCGNGMTYIGADNVEKDASDIVGLFNEAGFKTVESKSIRRMIWEKIFVNSSLNSFSAIVRGPFGVCFKSEYALLFMNNLISEAVEVANADGYDFAYEETFNMVKDACDGAANGYSSMTQDVMNKRKTEIDSINGYVVKKAELYNIEVPYHKTVLNLVHAIESTY